MTTQPEAHPITFADFRKMVARELEIDESRVVPEASFTVDLLADSIQLVALMLSFEERGICSPEEAAWEVETVGDAYRLYVEALT